MLADFGIAKLLQKEKSDDEDDEPSRADSVITLVGTVIGTPEYMSPEQARGRPPVDARSDVYAAGVLLYQLVTGRLPFRGESPIDVILQHIERPPLRPCSIVPGLHPGLERIILTALAKWPGERQQSARELADALLALLPELEGSPRPDEAAPARASDEEPDDAPPTVRMLPPEAWFTPTEVGLQPMLLIDAPEHATPAPASLQAGAASRGVWGDCPPSVPAPRAAEPPPVDPPSPWAMTPRLDLPDDLGPAPPPPVDSLLGWWALLIAVALLCAAIWMARYGP